MSAATALPFFAVQSVADNKRPSAKGMQKSYEAGTDGVGRITKFTASRIRAQLATDAGGKDVLNTDPDDLSCVRLDGCVPIVLKLCHLLLGLHARCGVLFGLVTCTCMVWYGMVWYGMLSPCRRIHAIAEALTSADEDTVVRMIRTAIEGNEVDKFFEAIFIAYGFGYRGALSIELLPLLSCDTTFLMPLLNAALSGTRMCV